MSATTLLGWGFPAPAGAATPPPACIRQATPFGQIQLGYCPSGGCRRPVGQALLLAPIRGSHLWSASLCS
jgi:hypothetical protein